MNHQKNFEGLLEELMDQFTTGGEIIRAFRANWNVTLKELEELTGIKDNNLSDIENNKKPIGVKTAIKIGTALGIMPQSLLFPNNQYFKDEEILQIEKKSLKFWKNKKKVTV